MPLDPALRTGKHRFQRLPHAQPKTVARRQAALDALYIDQARAADIGIAPQYRHGSAHISIEAWNAKAKQWDADHDVSQPVRPTNRKSRKRDRTPRLAQTYRAARRNAAPHVNRKIETLRPTHTWPLPDVPKLLAKARLARRAALAA